MKINRTFYCKIHPNFTKFAREKEQRHGWSRGAGDSLLLEEILISQLDFQKPLNWRHDFIYEDMKVDCKEIASVYFNIQRRGNKVAQYMESIISGDLTHFLFWRCNRDWDRYLVPNEQIKIEILGLCDARSILKNKLPSNKRDTSHYVPLETIHILDQLEDKEHETIA